MMGKYLIRISSISLLLFGVLFLINKTSAENSLVYLTLSITGGDISCSTATGINLGGITGATIIKTLSGNNWIGPNFGCTDLKGDAGRNYTIYSTALTGTPTGIIPANNITIIPTGSIMVTSGYCPSVTTGVGGTLDSTKNLIIKTNGTGEVCTFYLPNIQVNISITIPAWSPIGKYSSILTIVYPS